MEVERKESRFELIPMKSKMLNQLRKFFPIVEDPKMISEDFDDEITMYFVN